MFWGYSIIPFHTPCRPRRDSLVCTAEFRSSVTGVPVLLSSNNINQEILPFKLTPVVICNKTKQLFKTKSEDFNSVSSSVVYKYTCDTCLKAVSYTHLTLLTIYSV